MTKEAYPKKEAGEVLYANASAVTAGDLINIPNIGAAVAVNTYGAGVEGVYLTDGIFQLPITTGVTVVQGNRCYWDVSANTIILTGMAAGDFEIGRAVANGTAAGGFVDVRIGASAADYRTSGGLTAERVAAIVGQRTVVGTELLETITNAEFATTDYIFANFESMGTNKPNNIEKITKAVGSIVLNFTSIATGSIVNYQAMK